MDDVRLTCKEKRLLNCAAAVMLIFQVVFIAMWVIYGGGRGQAFSSRHLAIVTILGVIVDLGALLLFLNAIVVLVSKYFQRMEKALLVFLVLGIAVDLLLLGFSGHLDQGPYLPSAEMWISSLIYLILYWKVKDRIKSQ